MQALIKELMKEDQNRFLHLNCGLEVVTTSAEMAQALRARASKMPAALGIVLGSLPVVLQFSRVYQFFAPFGGVTLKADKDVPASSKLYDGLTELLCGSKDNALNYVINFYKDVLLHATPREKPVFIIGTSSLCFFFPAAVIYLAYSFCHPCFSFHIIFVLQCR